MTLTREDILNQTTGRKLDRWVQEHIFKVDLSEFHWERKGKSMFKETDVGVVWVEIPDYSEDISAAWEIVERLKAKNWQYVIASEGEKVDVTFYWDPHRMEGCLFDCKLPEAICKAALLAVLDL